MKIFTYISTVGNAICTHSQILDYKVMWVFSTILYLERALSNKQVLKHFGGLFRTMFSENLPLVFLQTYDSL